MDEQALNEKYPGRTVYREGDRIVVNIPVRFRRRNGRQMIFAAVVTVRKTTPNRTITLWSLRLLVPGSGRKNWSRESIRQSMSWPVRKSLTAPT